MCDRCDHLQRLLDDREGQIRALKTELGLRMRDGALGALMARLRVTSTQALLLVALYGAKGRTCSNEFLGDYLDCSPNDIKVHVHMLRKAMGEDAIATRYGVGYELSASGMSQVLALIEPPEIQTRLLTST